VREEGPVRAARTAMQLCCGSAAASDQAVQVVQEVCPSGSVPLRQCCSAAHCSDTCVSKRAASGTECHPPPTSPIVEGLGTGPRGPVPNPSRGLADRTGSKWGQGAGMGGRARARSGIYAHAN
jgi:hypothetical protein